MSLARLDLHPKPALSVRKKTVTGGIITYTTLLLVLLLFVLSPDTPPTENLLVDSHASSHPTDFHFYILFNDVLACESIRVEVLDSLGRSTDYGHTLHSAREVPWRGGGCSVQGHVVTPPSKGTFRFFATGQTGPGPHAVGRHQILALHAGEYAELSFIPAAATRFSLSEEAVCSAPCYWTYFVKLVPTTSNGEEGFQLAATRHSQKVALPSVLAGNLVFSYDTAPMRMEVRAQQFSRFHSLTSMLGIVGGAAALLALVAACAADRCGDKKKKLLL